MSYDTLELELFRHALLSVVDELEVNLTRTAYSPLIYEYKDYSVGVLDESFRLLAQSRGSLPLFVADLGEPVRDAVQVIGQSELKDGDVFITNYAKVSGQHLNNVIVATPIFEGTLLLGYMCIRAHWADVGGLSLGSVSWAAKDIFQEGVQYRGLRVMRGGKMAGEVLATIEANTRLPKHVLGDLSAQLGACRLGMRRWKERVTARWSADDVRALGQALQSSSAELARRRLRSMIPDGRYAAECWLDDSGVPGTAPLLLKLSIDVHDGAALVDLTEMPPQVAAPMNAGVGVGIGAVRLAFKSLLAPDIPVDEGFFEPFTFKTAPGTIITANEHAPMAFWNNAAASLIDLVFRAIGEKLPDRAPAGHHASMSIYAFMGRDEQHGPWMFIDTGHGGRGASRDDDGFSALKTMGHGDTRDIPVEIMESRYPIFCHGYRFVPGSGGAGIKRGGDGTEKVLEIQGEHIRAEFSLDRTLDPPWGLSGGQPGQAGDIEVKTPSSGVWASHKKAGLMPLPKGSLVRVRTSGGGGWGVPSIEYQTTRGMTGA